MAHIDMDCLYVAVGSTSARDPPYGAVMEVLKMDERPYLPRVGPPRGLWAIGTELPTPRLGFVRVVRGSEASVRPSGKTPTSPTSHETCSNHDTRCAQVEAKRRLDPTLCGIPVAVCQYNPYERRSDPHVIRPPTTPL